MLSGNVYVSCSCTAWNCVFSIMEPSFVLKAMVILMYSYYMQPFLKRAFFTTCLDCYVCFFAIFLNVNMNLSIWVKEYVTTDMLLKGKCRFGRLGMAYCSFAGY